MKKPRRISDEHGVSVTEYAVMLVLVALGVAFFGSEIQDAVTGAFQALIDILN